MADERKPAGGWSIETALQHVLSLIGANDHRYEQRFIDLQNALKAGLEAQHKAVNAALQSADRAVQKAETAAEKRFESVNEFRNTLADQQRNLMPRSEAEVTLKGMSEKMASLEKQIDNLLAERQGIKGGYGYAIGVVGFVLAIASLIALVVKQTP